MKRGVLSHVVFPAAAERRATRRDVHNLPATAFTAPDKKEGDSRRERRQPKTVLLALLDSLRRLVDGLQTGAADSNWAKYARSHSYSDAEVARKRAFVEKHLATSRPGVTLDLGANTGEFAMLAATHSRMVVAAESDAGAVEVMYRGLGAAGVENVTPLVMDLANPSPAQGWGGAERAGLFARCKPDFVLCLALLHHLRVAANIPLAMLLDWLRAFDAPVIAEFVGRDDAMFGVLTANKREDYADYNAANFEAEAGRRFVIRERLQLKDGTRELFLLAPV